MNTQLGDLLTKISEKFGGDTFGRSRHYIEVNIGDEAKKLGFSDLQEDFKKVNAIFHLKEPLEGMKVRIDGRTFKNYVKFDSGAVVPEYIAKETGLNYEDYEANESMILNYN